MMGYRCEQAWWITGVPPCWFIGVHHYDGLHVYTLMLVYRCVPPCCSIGVCHHAGLQVCTIMLVVSVLGIRYRASSYM